MTKQVFILYSQRYEDRVTLGVYRTKLAAEKALFARLGQTIKGKTDYELQRIRFTSHMHIEESELH